jgi:hypothetical protein
MTPDLDRLDGEQIDQLVDLLARFAAWRHCLEEDPDRATFAAYALAKKCSQEYEEIALDYLATVQAIHERSACPRRFNPANRETVVGPGRLDFQHPNRDGR